MLVRAAGERDPLAPRRSAALLLAACAALGAASAGCGTSILASYPLGVPLMRAHDDPTVAVQPLDPPVVTSRMYLETAPLRVACDEERVSPRVRVVEEDSFDAIGRLWVGFVAVGEGAGAATSFAYGAKNGGQDATPYVVGGVLVADALGALAYAVLAPDQDTFRAHVGAGTPQHDARCPGGVVVAGPSSSHPVGPDGALQGDVRPLVWALLHDGASATLSWAGRSVAWMPDAPERCALAVQVSDPHAAFFCGQVPGGAPAATRPRPWWPGRVTITVRLPGP